MSNQFFVMKNIVSLALLSLSLYCTVVSAEEGFWLPRQLEANSSELNGLNISLPHSLSLQHLQAVTGRIDNCSTAFVSKTGLLLTSYHCVAAYLNAPTGTKLISSNDVEQPIPNLQLHLLQQSQDVTVAINRQLNTESSVQARNIKFQQLKVELLTNCAQQSALHCELVSLHNGLEYYLHKYKVLTDIRLVYHPAITAPTISEQNWPRYGADYVLLRAYVGNKQQSASYSQENVAYKSDFIRLSTQGVKEDELVLSPSFSLHSQRYASAAEVQFNFEELLPDALVYLQQSSAVIEQLAPEGSDRAKQYHAMQSEFKQNLVQIQGLLKHYQRSSLLPVKQQRQQEVFNWISSSPVRQQLYAPVLEKLQLLLTKQQAAARRDLVLNYLKYAQLPALAVQLYKQALQPGRQQLKLLRQQLNNIDNQFDARVDMELALHFLGQYAQLPKAQRLPALDQYFALSDGFNREIVRHKLSAMYRGTSLTDANQREAWLGRSVEQFQQSNDPLLSFAVAIHDTAIQLKNEREQLQVEMASVRAAVMEILLAYNDAKGQATYAETNGSLRFSVGKVSGYQPMDAVWYQPFSRLKGLLKTQDNNKSVVATSDIAVRVADIPVNFLSNIDSCSGYGSAPTFNANGELVGVMFAGVQENLLADWYYDPELSRSVHVDSRFIIWQLQQTDIGKRILKELHSAR
ncbi:S46 family peptidase [Rheinheimera metallidurans]|uniref:S46 family peptidase n=1 Tax=Rheinheimera metallidurans TaxID=2925781 RepID=UPI0030028790